MISDCDGTHDAVFFCHMDVVRSAHYADGHDVIRSAWIPARLFESNLVYEL